MTDTEIKQDKTPEPAPKVPHVVEFKNVTKTYNAGKADEYTAIKDITFFIEDLPNIGELITMVGPSGCGKSTVLRLIAGLEPQFPPSTGEVLVRGVKVEGPGADRGMVFQSYTSFDNRTVRDNVAFGLECRGVPKKERLETAEHWIERVGLNVKKDSLKYPHELSGGMRQRVAIARTLILKPRILLMDEPFGALDPTTRLHMQDLLVSLWREIEATVFFVTHSIEEAVYLGDRCFIFSNSPGTLLKQVAVARPDRPAKEMQREKEFQETVFQIRDMVEGLEEGKE
jgi:NitT/TauT family transport system ATP-binding protein